MTTVATYPSPQPLPVGEWLASLSRRERDRGWGRNRGGQMTLDRKRSNSDFSIVSPDKL
jgi:hypothetical protein